MSETTEELKLTVTESAVDYLAELLSQQDDDVLGIRMFVNDAGTPKAETCLAYCRQADVQEDDYVHDYGKFTVWYERRSLPFLEDGLVDYAADRMGGQLTIKAPNAKLPQLGPDASLEDRVNYVLYNEVNPGLAAHGGQISLVEIVDESIAVLKFGGGCQGCGMVDMTLKEGVEKTLSQSVPEIKEVRDVTDHSDTSQAYFK